VRRQPSVIVLLLALACAGPAAAAPRELVAGLTYDQHVEFTAHGPVVAHVLSGPRPVGLWSLEPVLSNESLLGRERVTDMQRRAAAVATVAGVNGDFFNFKTGNPSGLLMRNGGLDHPPIPGRSSIGIDAGGDLRVDRVSLYGTWQGTGPRRTITDVNGPPTVNGISLFTPAWGPATPTTPGSVEVVLTPFAAATPNTELAAPVAQVSTNGGTPILPGSAVLVARGTAAARLQAEAPAGQTVKIRLILNPDWGGVAGALGGGPVLVRAGAAVFSADEQFSVEQLFPRRPRTAVGQTGDGRILLVAVDGGLAGYSAGVSNFELALLMIRLGTITAAALDSGGSTTMAFEGELLNRPANAGGAERLVSESLLLSYAGVYAPLPLEEVLSPNGDGVAESQQLSYKVVRPSNVSASLLGPDGVARYTFSGTLQPGVYPLEWPGLKPDGAAELEGRWHWAISALDDLGRASSVDRSFWLNNTLEAAKPVPPMLAVPRKKPRAVATVTLTRVATVTAQIETTSGVLLRKLGQRRAGPGELEVAWDGLTASGALAYPGRYVARVVARNGFGPVSLTATFAVRRLPPPAKPKPKPKPAKTRQ